MYANKRQKVTLLREQQDALTHNKTIGNTLMALIP
jgi:hypothetical protein